MDSFIYLQVCSRPKLAKIMMMNVIFILMTIILLMEKIMAISDWISNEADHIR